MSKQECRHKHGTFSQIYYITEQKARESERANESAESWFNSIKLAPEKDPIKFTTSTHLCAHVHTNARKAAYECKRSQRLK